VAQKFLNLACGDFYLTNNDWVNLDWYPHSNYVKKANLLGELRFKDETFDVIYTSHFIEHIPRENLDFVLRECFRVLKPSGVIRIVVPDLENIVREYIRNLDSSELEKAEFNSIELLDQCVRTRSGGQLASFRARQDLSQELREYISERTGYVYKIPTSLTGIRRKKSHLKLPKVTRVRIQWAYCKFLTKVMPKWFVLNHINFTNTGELHKWVYDESSLTNHLTSSGFKRILRYTSNTSQIKEFPFVPLDLDENLRTRKGSESIYIEAFK
jgi:SAM-dependent methyltransferase